MSDGGDRTITIVDDVVRPPEPRPGAMIVFAAGQASDRVLFFQGRPLRFGRSSELAIDDPGMSNDHAVVEHLGGSRWRVIDRASKNGTFVNSDCVRAGALLVEGPSVVVRMGMTVVLLSSDLGHYDLKFIRTEGNEVIGGVIADVYAELGKAARVGANTLIQGETGTGKGNAARAFHAQSGRRGKLLTMNCANLVGSIAESQLFGARKGAASGVEAQVGLFRAADGGTVFLDEIGELHLELQAKLLGVVQDKLVTPLGATTPEKVDFRLICATHRDLPQLVAEGRFREDLYMRIAEKTVHLPPLRERREEIPHLVALSLAGTGLRPNAQLIETCMLQPWPGNVRDLMRALTEAKINAEGDSVVTVAHLPAWARRGASVPPVVQEEAPRHLSRWEDEGVPSKKAQREAVRRYYEKYRNAKKAADLAGVPRSTAHRWLEQDGLLGDDNE